MLTVNVRVGETESVFQAKSVVATRGSERSDNVIRVECFDERYEPIAVAGTAAIATGTVFVMNDNGKTVATYYLPQ